MPPDDLIAPASILRHADEPRWTAAIPTTHGIYELWDPRRRLHVLVRVFCARGGRLAVANPCGCVAAFAVEMWSTPCFYGTHWRGPLAAPDALPASDDAAWRRAAPLDDHVRGRRPRCLLGVRCR
jgi:hypothetical protein